MFPRAEAVNAFTPGRSKRKTHLLRGIAGATLSKQVYRPGPGLRRVPEHLHLNDTVGVLLRRRSGSIGATLVALSFISNSPWGYGETATPVQFR